MATIWTIHVNGSSSTFPIRFLSGELQLLSNLGLGCYNCKNWSRNFKSRKFVVRALYSDNEKDDAVVVQDLGKFNARTYQKNPLDKLRESVSSVPFLVNSIEKFKFGGTNFTIGLCILVSMLLVIVVKNRYAARQSRYSRPGSVADLVRRGQLNSDRRGISTPLRYEDPFNNPMVKVSKNKLTVEMCGKVYKLAPVTLTNEQQNIHQRRRSRAYQWKRPTIFLKEGESVPPDVDPDTVRWIPANHPFATTSSDIDEDLAQNNVYQKHGVPFRIRAEHEALQKKLESLQNDQQLNKVVIDSAAARNFERPLKMKSENQELGSSNSNVGKPSSDENQNTKST